MTDNKDIPAIRYRHELDGLRAVAVLAVLGYHAGYNDLSGGFVGVDVFLVISGFLITQQVQSGLLSGAFDLPRFWLRRALRLIPAMLPVLACCVLSALILKGDGAFEDFLGHLLGAGLFVSNYVFLAEADYFARASETNLLLHTWSLSLEMQFYLIMPLVLILTHRFGQIGKVLGLAALAVASLALSEWMLRNGQESWAFFGVLPRFWEFAAGGMVALLPRLPNGVPLLGAAARAVGLGLILGMVILYANAPFPGLGALVPVLGTALILAAPDQHKDPVRWLFESRAMRWVGLRSYAIYLVHWPLMVTVTPAEMNQSEGILSAAIVASLFLGHLVYRYVETPLRSHPKMKPTPNIAAFAVASGLAVVLIWGLGQTGMAQGLRSILPLQPARAAVGDVDLARTAAQAVADQIHANEYPNLAMCSFDSLDGAQSMLECLAAASSSGHRTLLIGDSHGRDTLGALAQAYPGAFFTGLHQSSCSAATYVIRNSLCFPDLHQILDQVARDNLFDRVVLSSRWWLGQHEHAAATIDHVVGLGLPLTLIGPGPTFSAPMDSHIFRLALSGSNFAQNGGQLEFNHLAFDGAAVNQDFRVWSQDAAIGYFDRWALFCGQASCRAVAEDGGDLHFYDAQHLSPAGMAYYANALRQDPDFSAFMSAQ